MRRNEEYLPLVTVHGNEGNLFTIRSPAWKVGLRGGISKLEPIAAVGTTSPESVVRVGYVGDPLAIAGIVQ